MYITLLNSTLFVELTIRTLDGNANHFSPRLGAPSFALDLEEPNLILKAFALALASILTRVMPLHASTNSSRRQPAPLL